MKIVFNRHDNLFIAEQIIAKPCDKEAQVELNGIIFNVSYDIETDGYYEDDYCNGTGGFICTDANVIYLEMRASDLDVELDFDDELIKRVVEDELIF